jgi:hypothetical protein
MGEARDVEGILSSLREIENGAASTAPDAESGPHNIV